VINPRKPVVFVGVAVVPVRGMYLNLGHSVFFSCVSLNFYSKLRRKLVYILIFFPSLLLFTLFVFFFVLSR
jgi:hypothetical protein